MLTACYGTAADIPCRAMTQHGACVPTMAQLDSIARSLRASIDSLRSDSAVRP